MDRDLPMVEIDHLYRRFNMAKEKVDSVKEYFLRKVKGSLSYDAFYALEDVSINVEKGDVYGLIGLNGSGKSTLLKIIAGVMKPSAGRCVVRGSVAPLIELGAGFDIDLTGRENIFLNGTVLGMEPAYIRQRFDEIVDFSELQEFLDVQVKNYSSGMVARLAFSVATIMKPDILICDEILSVGDFLFQQKCEKRMNELMSGGTTVLLVSHSIEQIERMCNKAAWLNHGKVMAQGDCAGVCNEYKENARAGKLGEDVPEDILAPAEDEAEAEVSPAEDAGQPEARP
ncbi:ABC transporter ATP-binding protein [Ruminococcaceae bacterium OttesenSCG-928-D13]|nr:ABC transporter ATP-binding protein [Ruminococcaceae bacterium OttesenSCG-928-D13]